MIVDRVARVVTFGEMLLRLSPPGQDRLFQKSTLHTGFGGAEANVAVALRHLGLDASYVTRLPANLIGDAALAALRAEGVETDAILRGPERMGIYFVEPGRDLSTMRVVYDRSGSAFSRITASASDWPALLSGAAWFHGTGITAALGPGPIESLAAALAAAQSMAIPASLDLNFRPALWEGRDPRPLVQPLLERLDVLIANVPALSAMSAVPATDADLETPESAIALCRRLVDRYACRRVALTRRRIEGPRRHRWSASLYEADSGVLSQSRTWTVTVIDRVGGGDAFAAALIAALLRAAPSAEAVEFAVAAGALKLRAPGDFHRATVSQIETVIHGAGAARHVELGGVG